MHLRGRRRQNQHAAPRSRQQRRLAPLLALVLLILSAGPASATALRSNANAYRPVVAVAPNGATQLLVRLRDAHDTPASDSRIARGLRSQRELGLPQSGGGDIHLLTYADGQSASAAYQRLRNDPRVEQVEPELRALSHLGT